MFRILHILLLIIAIPCVIWCVGILWFLLQIPNPASPSVYGERADAIVVLTGGSMRLEHGLKLLTKNKGKRLFVTGVYDAAKPVEIFSAISPEAKRKYNRYKERIIIGKKARDTHGNAAETASWVKQYKIQNLRLVTAGYHMPRSMLEMRRALPGIIIIPDPVFPAPFSSKDWRQHISTLKFIISEYHKYLATILEIYDAL